MNPHLTDKEEIDSITKERDELKAVIDQHEYQLAQYEIEIKKLKAENAELKQKLEKQYDEETLRLITEGDK